VFATKPFHSPEGRAIVKMGLRTLPFVIEEIRNGDPNWKWAAFYIVPMKPPPSNATWESIVSSKNAELLERYSRDWLQLREENKGDPTWNVFLRE
jgi:hypothetical protein